VVARDQETVVIGGLIQERITRSVSKVPVLGSLPLLGWLFPQREQQEAEDQSVALLTPYIIRDQSDVRRIFERKMAEREEFVGRFYNGTPSSAGSSLRPQAGPLARLGGASRKS